MARFVAFLFVAILGVGVSFAAEVQCNSALVNISEPLKVIAHLEPPFVMRRHNTSTSARTQQQDLHGYSLDLLATITTRFNVRFTMKMLTKVELDRWHSKRDLVESKMFSRSLDMSANVLKRKDNQRQNLPPLMNGTIKAVFKHYEDFDRVRNYTRLYQIATRPSSDDAETHQESATPDGAWKFGAVENGEAWLFLKRSKLTEVRKLYVRVWHERRRRNLPQNRTDGLAKLKRSTADTPYVFFDESIMADYYAALDDQLYTIDIVDASMGEPIEYVFGNAFDMRDNVKRNLTCIFLQLADDGTLDRLKDKWFNPRKPAPLTHTASAAAAPLRSLLLLLLASAAACGVARPFF